MSTTKPKNKPENPLIVVLCNIALPVIVLNQGAKHFGENGPLIALLVALAFPIGYGIFDFKRRHKPNFVSIVGLVNVSITGSFALFHLEGGWFWLKEAFFPLLIGSAIAIYNHFGRPFLFTVFWNENLFQIDNINKALESRKNQNQLTPLFKKSSDLFSASFFISGTGNFYLAKRIFLPIDPTLNPVDHAQALNSQIAQMTWRGYTMIALPMMVFMGFVLWYLISHLKSLTGLKTEEILAADPSKK